MVHKRYRYKFKGTDQTGTFMSLIKMRGLLC